MIYDEVIAGNRTGVEEKASGGYGGGPVTRRILNEGLISAMGEVGIRFERQEFYVPEMVVACA